MPSALLPDRRQGHELLMRLSDSSIAFDNKQATN